MIAYVTVGADDMARAKRFCSAFLPALEYGLKEGAEGLSYALPVEPGQSVVLPPPQSLSKPKRLLTDFPSPVRTAIRRGTKGR